MEELIYKTRIDFGDSLASFKQVQIAFLKTRATIDQLSRSATTLKKELRDGLSTGKIKEGERDYRVLIAKIAETEKGLKGARAQQRELNKEFDRLALPVDSMKRLRAEVNKLQTDLDKHTRGVSITSEEYDDLKDKVAKGRLAIINYDQSINDGRTNVGRYAQSLKDLKPNINNMIGSFARLASSVGIAFSTAAVKSFINETTQAFEIQAQNEGKLLAAIKLRVGSQEEAEAVQQRLLQSALGLQQQTNGIFTDEQIIQQQAYLVSLGKTEEEINKIISASLDLSAGANLSLDSAVKNLTKTYSGLSGELGEAIPQLRDLSQEELKAGAAVELVSKQFAGQAVAVGESGLGAIRGYRAGIGDLKEEIGEQLLPIQERITKAQFEFFTLIRDGIGVVARNIDVVATLAITIGVLIAQQKIINALQIAGAVTTKAYGVAKAFLSGKINLVAKAQALFNKVLKANPIGLVITAIGLFTAGILALRKNIDTVIDRFDKWSDRVIQSTKNIPILGKLISRLVNRFKFFLKAIKDPAAAFTALKETAITALENIKAAMQVLLNTLSIGFKRIKQLGANASFNTELSAKLEKEINDLKGKNEDLRKGVKNLGETFSETFNRNFNLSKIEIPEGDAEDAKNKGKKLGDSFGKGAKEAAEGSLADLNKEISKLNTEISKTTNENVIEKKLREIGEKKKDITALKQLIQDLKNELTFKFRLSDEEFKDILENGSIPTLKEQVTDLRKALETAPDNTAFAEELERLIKLEDVLIAKENERLAKAKELLAASTDERIIKAREFFGEKDGALQTINPLTNTLSQNENEDFDPLNAESLGVDDPSILDTPVLEPLEDPRIAHEQSVQDILTEITAAAAADRTEKEIAERWRLEEQEEKFNERRIKLLGGGLTQMATLTGRFLAGQEKDNKKFAKAILKTALDIVEKQVLISIAQATITQVGQSGPVLGTIQAAIAAALIKGAFAALKATVGNFEKGGVIGEGKSMLSSISKRSIKPGVMGGDYHSDPSGGTLIQHGKEMAMVERGEFIDYDEFGNVNVVNRKSSRLFSDQLRKIKGKSFDGKRAFLSKINSFQGFGFEYDLSLPENAMMRITPFNPPLPMMRSGGTLGTPASTITQADISRLEELMERQVIATENINLIDDLQEAARRRNIDDTLSRP